MKPHLYATSLYARSLHHWGTNVRVEAWRTDVIVRTISPADSDAFGTYPICVLPPDGDIAGGLAELRARGLVAVTLVLDDLHRPDLAALRDHFDLVVPFKKHAIYRPALAGADSRHHRYEIARATRTLRTGVFDLGQDLAAWIALYSHLVARHQLGGVHVFPNEHHELLAAVPDITAIGAWRDDRLVSAHLWAVHDGKVHSHLAASSPEGYSSGAAYAVYDAARRHFAQAEWVNFGGGAGAGDDPADGLMRFKKGFANDTADAYICGKVLNAARYEALSRGSDPAARFFPAYRQPKLIT